MKPSVLNMSLCNDLFELWILGATVHLFYAFPSSSLGVLAAVEVSLTNTGCKEWICLRKNASVDPSLGVTETSLSTSRHVSGASNVCGKIFKERLVLCSRKKQRREKFIASMTTSFKAFSGAPYLSQWVRGLHGLNFHGLLQIFQV
ncbi:hypothetical protein Bpfe_011243 [Biomphalaria pfeifferi]|uniref:Uncharacterized protein n=1 Tax=Biomphalaria pfeifferi TaxID=112525 RepID=A0AAD8BSB7_BIOPF|nr:hypothetical protein Bpfe_011243 [Biomphalaria pfeifferi]